MEFKKINDTKFQCILDENDLDDNNISLDDFFRNDTEKIHSLLEVVMDEAQKSIGVMLSSGVLSLQLAPQPNHTIVLTISSGKDDFADMIKQAGERAANAIAAVKSSDRKSDNIIKRDDESSHKATPFKPKKDDLSDVTFALDEYGNPINIEQAICKFARLEDLELFCKREPKAWGVKSRLYKDNVQGGYYLVLERGRSAKLKFSQFLNSLMEYGVFISCPMGRIAYIREHFEVLINDNAIGFIKKYTNS